MRLLLITLAFALLSFSFVYAQAPIVVKASAVTSTTLAPAAPVNGGVPVPTFLDKILAAVNSVAGLTAGILIGFEVLLRMVPSIQPLSILIPVKYVVDSLLMILGFLSNFLVSLINIANNSQNKLEPKA